MSHMSKVSGIQIYMLIFLFNRISCILVAVVTEYYAKQSTCIGKVCIRKGG